MLFLLHQLLEELQIISQKAGQQELMADPLLASETHVLSESLVSKEGDQALSALLNTVDQEPGLPVDDL